MSALMDPFADSASNTLTSRHKPTDVSEDGAYGFPKTYSPQASVSAESGYVFDDVIPPNHSQRTLVLCFDGTGDQFGEYVLLCTAR